VGVCITYLLVKQSDNVSREHYLRVIYNTVRYIVKTSSQWLMMLYDLP
jgi:hypothetical protein